MNRLRGCLWFAAGLLLAITAGILAYFTIQRVARPLKAAQEQPKVQVLVAARDIPLSTVITHTDVVLREVAPEMVPADALRSPEPAMNQLTTADIAQGEIILARRLITPDYVGPRASFVMDPKQVIIAIPATSLLSSLDIVRPADHVDLMFTYDFAKSAPEIETALNTLTILQDIRVAAVIRQPTTEEERMSGRGKPTALLLAVDPQDALTIKHFLDMGGAADLALRSPSAEGLFDIVNVDGDYLIKRYKIQWRAKR